jgi:hypothetical protein
MSEKPKHIVVTFGGGNDRILAAGLLFFVVLVGGAIALSFLSDLTKRRKADPPPVRTTGVVNTQHCRSHSL